MSEMPSRASLEARARPFAFLLFALPPVAVIVLMAAVWERQLLYLTRFMTFECLKGMKRAARISEGGLEWMTYHFVAMILFPLIILLCIAVIWRNTRGLALGLLLGGAALLAALNLSALGLWSGVPDPGSGVLLRPVRALALIHFGTIFAEYVWQGMLFDYALTAVAIAFLIVASAAVMEGTWPGAHVPAAALERKRRDVKILIVAASVALTFSTQYWGSWLAWPARFFGRGCASRWATSAEQVKEFATGAQLYFGTAYTLAILSFAVPAVLVLSRHAAAAKEPGDAPLGQRVFTKAEVTTLIGALSPFLSALLAGWLKA